MEKHSKQGRRACLISFVVPVVAMILIFAFLISLELFFDVAHAVRVI